MADKKGRIANLIQRDVSDIVMKEIEEPIVKLASINEVKVNFDCSHAKIFVSHLDANKIDELVEFLNGKKGFIRTRLSKMLDIYKVPDLLFVKDTLYDQGAKIDTIINSWNK